MLDAIFFLILFLNGVFVDLLSVAPILGHFLGPCCKFCLQLYVKRDMYENILWFSHVGAFRKLTSLVTLGMILGCFLGSLFWEGFRTTF